MVAQPATYDRADPTDFRRVSKREHCPICNDFDSRCLIFASGDVLCAHLPSDEPCDKYLGGYWHRAGRGPDEQSPRRPQRTPAPRSPRPASADAPTRHAVYSRLLELCPLVEGDRAYLMGPSCQHTADALEGRYGTLPPKEQQGRLITALVQEFGVDVLRTVPGIVTTGGRLRFNGAGLLVAVRDVERHIVGFQVRYGDSDYRWLSGGNGPSTGVPAGIAYPRERRTDRLYIVESPKTANILCDWIGAVVIATAGQSNWQVAIEPVRWLMEHDENIEVVVVGLDTPKPEATDAAKADNEAFKQRLAAAVYQMGLHATIARWTFADGKGPDDCLLGGHTFTREVYRPTAIEAPAAPAAPQAAPFTRMLVAMAQQLTIKERAIAQRDALWDAQQQVTQAANREANVEAGLGNNPFWPEGLKKTLRYVVRTSGFKMGDTIPARGPILFLTNPETLSAAGMHRNTFDMWAPILKAGGYVGRTRTQPVGEGRPYHEWYLLGDAVNALWDTIATAPLPDEIRAKRDEQRAQQKMSARRTREKHEQVEHEAAQAKYEKTVIALELLDVKKTLHQATGEGSLAQQLAATTTIKRLSHCHGCQAPLDESAYLCAECRAWEPQVAYGQAGAGDTVPAELFTGDVNNSAETQSGATALVDSSTVRRHSTYVTSPVNNSALACITCGGALIAHEAQHGYVECLPCRKQYHRYGPAGAQNGQVGQCVLAIG